MTRVCAYDRAGGGRSELGPELRDATRIADELHTLPTMLASGPLALIVHSFGWIFIQVYAAAIRPR
jgi:pimeloyl-ACP methyl ester carboxylesterase